MTYPSSSQAARRVAVVSAAAAVLLAATVASFEHHRAAALDEQMALMAAADGARQEATAQAECPYVSTDEAQVAANDDLPKVRQAARQAAKDKLPDAKQEGVFTLTYSRTDGFYVARVDATLADSSHQAVDVLVLRYTRKNGSEYWRGETVGRDQAARLMERAAPDAP